MIIICTPQLKQGAKKELAEARLNKIRISAK